MKIATITILCLLSLCSTAFALNYLQLDASDGEYNEDTQSVVSTADKFTLYALVDSSKEGDIDSLGQTFYISAALTKDYEPVDKDGEYGSFIFDDTRYFFVGSAVYGTPPVAVEAKDLPEHGIFPTYFYEFEFTINQENKSVLYNSEDNPGELSVASSDEKNYLYYAEFDVDVSSMVLEYEVHFDFYTVDDEGKIIKAPFSHDAESGGDVPETPDTPVPEPATILLLGLGLLGMAGMGRRKLI